MEAQEYNFVKYKVIRLTGIDLNAYKSQQVQRRLKTYLQRSGFPNWPSFFRAIQDDPQALAKFKNYLTINVSSFFRDQEKFDYLRQSVLPELLHRRPRLRVWSAGCSHGHEPYSLAIMLSEATSEYNRHFVLATDIDHDALERAQAGGPYSADELANVAPTLLARYFDRADETSPQKARMYSTNQSLRRKVVFRYHNLLADSFEQDFDLIVCRNVVIYFTPEVKQDLYNRFHDALHPGGILFLGGTEVMSRAADIGFETLNVSFYRRSAAKT
ncbi:MAG: protein-glutamate O-methyltransferase CheR [Anaerolineae bacterium]|nr:protein-glutamate O-methyltransferase CheR [Anaerolineae bacterium]